MGCGASNANTVSNIRTPAVASSPQPRRAPTAVNTPMASQPVTLPLPFRHGASITQGELNNMRTEFWTTRVEGNHQMWQTIRSACEALLEEDVGLANAIIDAASLITPNGTMEIVYDERGQQYKVPQYAYTRPMELVTQPVMQVPSSSGAGGEGNGTGSGSGKGVLTTATSANGAPLPPAPGGTPLRLRVRVNPGDHNLNVTIGSNGTIAHLKHHLVEQGPAENPALQGITVARQRIIYMGKQLPDNLKLGDAKFDETKVVQVFLKPV
eukprot:gene19082-13770_t